MIENVVRNIGGVGIFGIISICLFFTFFSGMLLWAFSLKKRYLKEMGELPLEEEGAGPGRAWCRQRAVPPDCELGALGTARPTWSAIDFRARQTELKATQHTYERPQ